MISMTERRDGPGQDPETRVVQLNVAEQFTLLRSAITDVQEAHRLYKTIKPTSGIIKLGVQIADALVDLGQDPEDLLTSITDLTKTSDDSQFKAIGFYGLAGIYAKQGKFEVAEPLLQQASAADPDGYYSEGYLRVAEEAARQGRDPNPYIQKAVEITGSDFSKTITAHKSAKVASTMKRVGQDPKGFLDSVVKSAESTLQGPYDSWILGQTYAYLIPCFAECGFLDDALTTFSKLKNTTYKGYAIDLIGLISTKLIQAGQLDQALELIKDIQDPAEDSFPSAPGITSSAAFHARETPKAYEFIDEALKRTSELNQRINHAPDRLEHLRKPNAYNLLNIAIAQIGAGIDSEETFLQAYAQIIAIAKLSDRAEALSVFAKVRQSTGIDSRDIFNQALEVADTAYDYSKPRSKDLTGDWQSDALDETDQIWAYTKIGEDAVESGYDDLSDLVLQKLDGLVPRLPYYDDEQNAEDKINLLLKRANSRQKRSKRQELVQLSKDHEPQYFNQG